MSEIPNDINFKIKELTAKLKVSRKLHADALSELSALELNNNQLDVINRYVASSNQLNKILNDFNWMMTILSDPVTRLSTNRLWDAKEERVRNSRHLNP